jgi:hypothetical protein
VDDTDPLKIHANQTWNAGGRQLMSLKTPTCLLLDNNKKFVSFGFEAENEYANLAMDGEQDKYYYFYRFKQPRALFYLRPFLFFICLLKL